MCAPPPRRMRTPATAPTTPSAVTAKELACKVIGEGANLGVTQKARIEYARKGGRCNSDAIDNSAGVNSSDMEVNIKIALGAAVRSGRLTTETRNTLLASMTDEVAELVLRNNYLQTLAISLSSGRGMEDFGYQARMMRQLESQGLLDRSVEYLPDDLTLEDMGKTGTVLTRPEIGCAARLCQADALRRAARLRRAGRRLSRAGAFPLLPRCDGGRATTARSSVTGCGARSSPPCWRTRSSTGAGPTFLTRIGDQTGADAPQIAQSFGRRARLLQADHAERRDRRARHVGPRRDAAGTLFRRTGSGPRPDRLVPARDLVQ